jgi:uncharacterized membrane protein YkoI
MKTFSTILTIAMAAATLSFSALAPAHAQGQLECLSDAQIQAAIKADQIKSWPKIKRLAGISAYDEVSDVEVCLQDTIPYYYVNVVSPNGEATKMVVNAIDGTV